MSKDSSLSSLVSIIDLPAYGTDRFCRLANLLTSGSILHRKLFEYSDGRKVIKAYWREDFEMSRWIEIVDDRPLFFDEVEGKKIGPLTVKEEAKRLAQNHNLCKHKHTDGSSAVTTPLFGGQQYCKICKAKLSLHTHKKCRKCDRYLRWFGMIGDEDGEDSGEYRCLCSLPSYDTHLFRKCQCGEPLRWSEDESRYRCNRWGCDV